MTATVVATDDTNTNVSTAITITGKEKRNDRRIYLISISKIEVPYIFFININALRDFHSTIICSSRRSLGPKKIVPRRCARPFRTSLTNFSEEESEYGVKMAIVLPSGWVIHWSFLLDAYTRSFGDIPIENGKECAMSSLVSSRSV